MKRADTDLRHKDLVYRAEAAIKNREVLEGTLSSVARYLGVSRGHLSRTYKNSKRTEFHAFVHQWRKAEAKKVLLSLSVSMKTVAGRLLFSSADYFPQWFRKHFGIAPTSYRAHILRNKHKK